MREPTTVSGKDFLTTSNLSLWDLVGREEDVGKDEGEPNTYLHFQLWMAGCHFFHVEAFRVLPRGTKDNLDFQAHPGLADIWHGRFEAMLGEWFEDCNPQTTQIPGHEGDWVVVMTPHGD